jgi:hypothetical protein
VAEPEEQPIDQVAAFLSARSEMIEMVKRVLSLHRPERLHDRKVVTCTAVYDAEPHAVIAHQWPGWRDHVAPEVVDALFALLIPAQYESPEVERG